VGHVAGLRVQLCGAVHGILQDAQKLRRDLFPACNGSLDRFASERSGESLELLEDFGCFHCAHRPGAMCQNNVNRVPTKHTWTFKSRLRARAFGWRGSRLACQRLKEAVTEIKSAAKLDPVTAGEGVVSLMERIWPAFESIDTSSGALGMAVGRAQQELLPIAIEAPADRKTRDKWLERLWQAIEEDGVNYLSPVEERWGELCGSSEVASRWADRLVGLLRTAWSDPRPGGYVQGTTVCLSSLLGAGRHRELLEVLALRRFPFWSDREFGMRALLAEGRTDEALAYAEASRGLNQPDRAIDAACERILLDAGREEEAYRRYALSANVSSTGLATFRGIAKKYPGRDPEKILLALAAASGDPGRWFAAAKDAGFLDLALEFAGAGRTDPRTLSRASRDLLKKDARFSLKAGRLAIQGILAGHGYELTSADVSDACTHVMAAAQTLGVAAEARADMLALAARHPDAAFRDVLVRHCSANRLERPPWTPHRETIH
jgi:hypothetical protein